MSTPSAASKLFTNIAKQCASTTPSSMSRPELLGILSELIAMNASSLTSRPSYPAALKATIMKTEGSAAASSPSISFSSPASTSDSVRGPLIRTKEEHTLPLSLWAAVLPWEVQRGYSLTPDAVIRGHDGLPFNPNRINSFNKKAEALTDDELLKDDPFAVLPDALSNSSSGNTNANTNNNDALRRQRRAEQAAMYESLKGSNGVLFVHRDRSVPQYWSGGIQGSLDVSFLSLPTDDFGLAAAKMAKTVRVARNGLQASPFQRLGWERSSGYGPLDAPSPYQYYIKSPAAEMPLQIESNTFLDPFPSVLRTVPAELGGEWVRRGPDDVPPVFCGDHEDGIDKSPMDRRYHARPHLKGPVPITAILETRKKLIRDFLRTFVDDSSDSRGARSSDEIVLNLMLSRAMMEAMEEKELFYRDLVHALEDKVGDMLEDCHRPRRVNEDEAAAAAAAERQKQQHQKTLSGRAMESWKAMYNKGSPKAELLAEVAPIPAATHRGTEGSFSLSKLRAASRVAGCQPGMMVTPPIDVELFAAATRLGLAHMGQQRMLPRLVNDLTKGYITPENVTVLYELATDPSIQLYPRDLVVAIHNAHNSILDNKKEAEEDGASADKEASS